MSNSQIINQINQDFYQAIADSFDATRQASSPGWEQLAAYLPNGPLRVLDLACGNGRLLKYLLDAKHNVASYVGLDTNKELLSKAKQVSDNPQHHFHVHDLTHELPVLGFTPNLITLFGIMHHLSDISHTKSMFTTLANLLDPEGILVLTTWEYQHDPRFAKKRIDPAVVKQSYPELEIYSLTPQDHFLSWHNNPTFIRYVRSYEASEIADIATATNLKIKTSYSSDGKTNDLNQYYIAIPQA